MVVSLWYLIFSIPFLFNLKKEIKIKMDKPLLQKYYKIKKFSME